MKLDLPYRNRAEAGRFLAEALSHYKAKPGVIVLGLTRGGVPVAVEVAQALRAPLDAIVVRKLTPPSEPELAIGAIAADGIQVLDRESVRVLGLSDGDICETANNQRKELERQEGLYRSGRPPLELKERTAILVDDGLATGSTMLAAVAFARKRKAKRVVVAVPIGSAQALNKVRSQADECVCLAAPDRFYAVGEWYWNFLPVSDDEVVKFLDDNAKRTMTVSAA